MCSGARTTSSATRTTTTSVITSCHATSTWTSLAIQNLMFREADFGAGHADRLVSWILDRARIFMNAQWLIRAAASDSAR